MSVPAISLMRPTSHRVERNQKKRAEAMCVAGRYSGCLYFSLLFRFFFLNFCVCICVGACHMSVYPQRPEECIGSFLQTMVLKVNCLSTWVLGPGNGFAVYLGKTLPFHGLEALMSFVMAVLMSVIFRAPRLPTNNKNSGCHSRSSNPSSSSGTSRCRAASGVVVAAAVIIMVPSQE